MKQRVKQSGFFILMLCLGLSLGIALKHAYTKLSFNPDKVMPSAAMLHLAQPKHYQLHHFNQKCVSSQPKLRVS